MHSGVEIIEHRREHTVTVGGCRPGFTSLAAVGTMAAK
jgi:hypothetical protein